ncbi:hypothetical protein DJ66_1172 [Candidatus Liberibacter solanacearum]|uniref:Uncharacterized protein n=1 Tax=Candidatus Liberibacter solanacearum TaxID=556287 RepID=A0A0F4VLJ2_9HYPH|nr:hypothetical protein [Candidatus Liberibacter solanacearum]KJZ81577.1 hypothetical protein DJ66_1172 [Candidatus Liberibacter solanacearum]
MPREQQKNPWSKGLSNIFQGATSGSMVGGPWGALAGGLLGGATSVIDYLFSSSDQEEKQDEGSHSSVLGGAVPLNGDELNDARQKDAMSFFSGRSSANQPRRITSSMLLAGGYSR